MVATLLRSVCCSAAVVLIASPVLAGQPAGQGTPAVPGAARLQICRPRLFFRPTAWNGGLSVEQLGQRATTQPFSERVKSLRGTRANLAMKWLVGGDEAAARAAVESMKAFEVKKLESDEGSYLIDVALAYDWLFNWPGFTPQDKQAVEARMLQVARAMRAGLTGSGVHVYHTRMYSWTAAVGMVGLALHDVSPEARDYFSFAREYYETRLVPARKLQGGAMHSGLTYGPNCLLFPLLQFLKAARSAADVDFFHPANTADADWLRELPAFLIHATQPDAANYVNYADVATLNPSRHICFILDILGGEYKDRCAAELARRIREKLQTAGYHAEWSYLFLAFHDPAVQPAPLDDLPLFRVFGQDGIGHVFIRSDWSDKATQIHFRCGDYFDDHGHFDQGGFTIFRQGLLALKGGSYIEFSSDHRNRYFKQAISTNTVIFNDPADPADEGAQRNPRYQEAATPADYLAHKKNPATQPDLETGDIVAVDDPAWVTCEPAGRGGPVGRSGPVGRGEPAGPPARPEDGRARGGAGGGFHSIVADVTAAWDPRKVKRFVRTLAWVDNTHLVVVDETETATPAVRARWLLHAQVEPKELPVDQSDAPRPAGWRIRLPGSVLAVQPLLPVPNKVTLIGGPGHECDVNGVNYTYIQPREKARRGRTEIDPALGLWRLEIESAQPQARRLFVIVLTPKDQASSAIEASAEFVKNKLVVRIGRSEVTFHKVRP